MAIDYNKILFLQYNKADNVWQDVTSNIYAYKTERNSCSVRYTTSEQWYHKSYRDIRILDNPKKS